MIDFMSWMLMYILLLVSVVLSFLVYDFYKERKNRRD